ncbi:MAG TPA: PaaI family thioesterase [Noviherbaspirillum sp.]|nr:PaaI family thioesterase [Noviherbaspirillum sp.]
MHTPNPHYRDTIAASFREAQFLVDLGIRLVDCGPGWCETVLELAPRHCQHHGFVHAGVQATIADHTAGAAAMSVTPEGSTVLTSEFKIHLLRPGKGERLTARAQVLKPGRMFHVVECEVFALTGDERSLVSKLSATMAVVERSA